MAAMMSTAAAFLVAPHRRFRASMRDTNLYNRGMSDVGGEDLSPNDAHAVLERFVVDNDELLELEERIGRFNIFDALGVARAEIRHSNFLSWLLDPNESHGQGALFLTAILMDLLKEAPPSLRPLSPVELDGEELRGVEVHREWKNIDLLITCKQPPFVIAIENKIDTGEGDGQLERYKKIVHEHFSELKPMFVYLTTDGSEPSDEDWVPYSYADVHRVLERVRRTGHGAIGDDVEAFLEHYLRLIGSRFMDDPKIDELCQRIYKNHRQALQLIFERVGSPAAGILGSIEDLVLSEGHWTVLRKSSRQVVFIPREWDDLLPPIGKGTALNPRHWIVARFEIHRKRGYVGLLVRPTIDPKLRRRAIERLIRDDNEFGLSMKKEKITDNLTRLGRKAIASWNEEEGPDEEKLIPLVPKQLASLRKRLARVPDALRPIIEEWEKSQAR